MLIKGICEVYGRSEKSIKESLASDEAADLGEVASQSRVNQKSLCKPKPHLLAKVFEELRSIANQKGKDSMTKRKGIVRKLLVAAQGEEPKYIVRTLQGKLRIGVQKQTVLQALASAFVLTRPTEGGSEADIRTRDPKPSDDDIEKKVDEMEAAVKRAFCSIPSFDEVVPALLRGSSPAELVKTCAIRVGIPISPMLAKPTKGITEILDRFQNIAFTAEFKYDGERAQVHISGDKLEVYSRNSENTSSKYPDVIEVVRGAMKPDIKSCILDTEVVAFDPATKKILPFQTLTTRAKKNVTADEIKVTVCIYAFDLILLNGESLCGLPLSERRAKLKDSLNEVEDKLFFAKHRDLNAQGQDELEAFLQESIDGSCEGLMLKTLDENATYEPSRRSLNWLKLKKDYLDGLGDSVDLVVLGAWHGKGKRSGTYGAFLLGVYDPEEEGYQTTCKIGTGFSDQDLKDHHAFFSPKAQADKPSEYDVDDKLEPDVWFEPCQVWECKAADLQVSPIHTAAKGAKAAGKGIGLRFPRFLHIREDKSPENATQACQIVEMFEAQAVQAAGNAHAGDDDDED
jgi:DNA ligase-1